MTDRERVIITAYTGITMVAAEKLDLFYQYLNELFGRPVYTHEIPLLADEIKERSKADFLKLCKDDQEWSCESCKFSRDYNGLWCISAKEPFPVAPDYNCNEWRRKDG